MAVLKRIDQESRNFVEEITLNLSDYMRKIIRSSFPHAKRVIDRFHVQKPAYAAVQELRIKHRWEAIQQANDEMKKAKLNITPYRYANGDTGKELLMRSRYLLFKSSEKWAEQQRQRAAILFNIPTSKRHTECATPFVIIFAKNTMKDAVRLSMARWYNKAEEAGFQSFNVLAGTCYEHYDEILNFYNNRSSNAHDRIVQPKLRDTPFGVYHYLVTP